MFIAMTSYFIYTLLSYSNPVIDYVDSFLSTMILTAYSYYGHRLPISIPDYNSTVSIPYITLGTLVWAIVLTVADISLLRKLYLRQVEEQRMF